MELQIVNSDSKYPKVKLIEPTTLGYIHIAAEVRPSLPFMPNGHEKHELLERLKQLAHQLEQLGMIKKATVFDAILFGPGKVHYLEERGDSVHVARFDVVVLIETESHEAAREVQQTPEYQRLIDALKSEAKHMHVARMRNAKCIADVDKTEQGLFLFNYFVADDVDVLLQAWEYTAGWFAVETGLNNSTLLVPQDGERSDYVVINNARWDGLLNLLPSLMKRSFHDYLMANLEANRAGAMPILYRLA